MTFPFLRYSFASWRTEVQSCLWVGDRTPNFFAASRGAWITCWWCWWKARFVFGWVLMVDCGEVLDFSTASFECVWVTTRDFLFLVSRFFWWGTCTYWCFAPACVMCVTYVFLLTAVLNSLFAYLWHVYLVPSICFYTV